MAKDYEFDLFGQCSLYKGAERQFKVYFSEPENGTNEETGLLLLLAGYGGNANSNIYKKMRRVFADEYNLITIQCNYFGWQFMQSNDNVVFDMESIKKVLAQEELINFNSDVQEQLNNISKIRECEVKANADIVESYEEFNDMGLIQAIDNLTAVNAVIEILNENNIRFNTNKIIAYGNSHGAFISYLCNAFAPNLFSTIIDNSSYIYPIYLDSNRFLMTKYNKFNITISYDYLISKIVFDKDIYRLNNIYKQFENKSKIIAFHGTRDALINHEVKIKFLSRIKNSYIEVIDEDKIDGVIFKNNTHGLGADYLELFKYVHGKYLLEKKNTGGSVEFKSCRYLTNKYSYNVMYDNKVPNLIVYEL